MFSQPGVLYSLSIFVSLGSNLYCNNGMLNQELGAVYCLISIKTVLQQWPIKGLTTCFTTFLCFCTKNLWEDPVSRPSQSPPITKEISLGVKHPLNMTNHTYYKCFHNIWICKLIVRCSIWFWLYQNIGLLNTVLQRIHFWNSSPTELSWRLQVVYCYYPKVTLRLNSIFKYIKIEIHHSIYDLHRT